MSIHCVKNSFSRHGLIRGIMTTLCDRLGLRSGGSSMLHLRWREESFYVVLLNHRAPMHRHVTHCVLSIPVFIDVYVKTAVAAC